jgi:hypothetical protein
MQTKHDRVVLSGMAFSGIMLVLLVLIALSVTGCNTFNRIVKNEALVSQLAVEAATARVIHEHPGWKDGAIKIAGNAITMIDGKPEVNLASVEEYVKGMVNWSRLVPEEQALVSTLISQVAKNLEDSFRAEHITEPLAQMVQVRQVLVWIRSAAERQ